ncbi:MAG: hypothetical protein KDD55_07360 [Bdellovibrionales bacterium]|nr:hypothetical protein [Bdellovibrionales bacterium]
MTQPIQIDEWAWGREQIIWGYDPSHEYTCKILEPKKGRQGCLSLQYHHKKSESWIVYRGVAWAVIALEGKVCTRVLRKGDIQNLPAGSIHRLMGLSDDLQVIEPSTPDAHAADKSVKKDVVRLHCVFGRECSEPRSEEEAALVKTCIEYTEEAIGCVERGNEPPEHNREWLNSRGAFSLSL